MDFDELYNLANKLAKEERLNDKTWIGKVASVLLTADNNIYSGICLKTTCSLGFCAEEAAISEMLKNKESRIIKIVAVYDDGEVVSPCGKCRELIYQINHNNLKCEVLLQDKIVTLDSLLPEL